MSKELILISRTFYYSFDVNMSNEIGVILFYVDKLNRKYTAYISRFANRQTDNIEVNMDDVPDFFQQISDEHFPECIFMDNEERGPSP